jgi:hypothetical protein
VTRPGSYLLRMVLFLVAVIVVTALLSDALLTAFRNNPLLNSLILCVLLIGVAWNLIQVARLGREVTWAATYQNDRAGIADLPSPRLLAPMARMLASRDPAESEGRRQRFTLSSPAMRGLLDGIASRLDESRELSRYMTGLLIFLGLLGTFWGLLQTVHSVADVIGGMTVGTGEVSVLFEQLKSGLAKPLTGMGTAFSASLFGLAGALVLGFLDLTAGQAQNRFYNELEEWLAGLTRLSSGALPEGEGGSVPVYVQALLEQTAENLEELQRIIGRGEEGRMQTNQAVLSLTERLSDVSDTMRTTQQLMLRLAEAQSQLGPAIQRIAEASGQDDNSEAARVHLRNIDLALQRLVAEAEQGRTQITSELRSDLRVLTRTVAALADESQR